MGAVVATGVSWASIPDATGQIHGCYKAAGKTTHALSVIDSARTATCPKGMLPLNWNTGALIYQNTQAFTGPFTGGQTVASFTVPAGLMCVQGAASAYTTGSPGVLLDVALLPSTNGLPVISLAINANEANSHKALVPSGGCAAVQAGPLTYTGEGSANTTSDSNDFGSISVQVYSQ